MTHADSSSPSETTIALTDLLGRVDPDLLSGVLEMIVGVELRDAVAHSSRLSARAVDALCEALDLPSNLTCEVDGLASLLLSDDPDATARLLRFIAAHHCAPALRRSIRREDREAAAETLGSDAISAAVAAGSGDASAKVPATRDEAVASALGIVAGCLATDTPDRAFVELVMGALPEPIPSDGVVDDAIAAIAAIAAERETPADA